MTAPHPIPAKPVRIAIIGETSIRPDGSLARSGALALALREHAGVAVTLRAIATSEADQAHIDAVLTAAGVASQLTSRADGDPAPIRLGDTLDIWGLFAHDVVILDADDASLRAFLTDLPAHTAPGVRILGTMDYVNTHLSARERDIALRFDTLIGSVAQARTLFGLPESADAESAANAIGALMRGANLRAAAIHDENALAIAALDEPTTTMALPDGASWEAIIAAVAITMARRHRWIETADLLSA
ncbi:MAG: hypothetical protein QM753_04090 [Thermomicrobiales bacterium]